MATRKTSSTTPAPAASRAAAKAEGKPTGTAARKRATSGGAKAPAAPAVAAPRETPARAARPVEAPTGEARYRWIAHAAYLRAEKRAFAPGREVDDWLAAEADFLAAYPGSKD